MSMKEERPKVTKYWLDEIDALWWRMGRTLYHLNISLRRMNE